MAETESADHGSAVGRAETVGEDRAEGPTTERKRPATAASRRTSSRWWPTRTPTPRSVSDRLIIYVVRALFFLVAAGLGIHGARTFVVPMDLFGGMVVGCVAAVVLVVLEFLCARSPVRTISSITFGLLFGLLLSLVLQPVIEVVMQSVSGELTARQTSFVQLASTTVFCYFGVAVLLATKDDFKFIIPFVEFRKDVKSHTPLLLDTSVFIDGRIEGLLETGVIDQRLEVPRFVMDELQRIADSPERALRERGRRGMDILQGIQRYHWVEVIAAPLAPDEDVDAGLLRLAMVHEGKILTTDFNLTKRARLQGVRVLNINDVANAMKPTLVPGDSVRVRLLRPGDEPGQAVGFLADGTMVVVESARERIGREVSAEVTSSLQTNAGKMVFGKMRESGRRAK